MKIRQKKAVKLPELIKWAWDNDKDEVFFSFTHDSADVRISRNGVDTTVGGREPCDDAEFFIEEEVEVGMDTVLDKVIVTCWNDSVETIKGQSIAQIMECSFNSKPVFINFVNPDGSTVLLWRDGRLL